jgi:hypothetical protein
MFEWKSRNVQEVRQRNFVKEQWTVKTCTEMFSNVRGINKHQDINTNFKKVGNDIIKT